MTIVQILYILLIHWIADFIMQDEKWAINKSSKWKALISHTITYSLCWLTLFPFLSISRLGIFIVITFLFHTVTDYITSRIVKNLFEQQIYGTSIPNIGAFTIIGFDQLLHYIQLFITFYILTQ